MKIGDTVRQTKDCSGTKRGQLYTVQQHPMKREGLVICPDSGNSGLYCSCLDIWEEVEIIGGTDRKIPLIVYPTIPKKGSYILNCDSQEAWNHVISGLNKEIYSNRSLFNPNHLKSKRKGWYSMHIRDNGFKGHCWDGYYEENAYSYAKEGYSFIDVKKGFAFNGDTQLLEAGNDTFNRCYPRYENLITSPMESNSSQSLGSKFSMLFKSEPEKTFIKAGILNENGSLTSEGQHIFIAWLLKENGAAFKKDVADPILAESKKKD